MKKIPDEFRKGIFSYKLIERDDRFAIYDVHMRKEFVGHELHLLRVSAERIIEGRTLEESERLAGTYDFGEYGWFFRFFGHNDSLAEARTRQKKLSRRKPKK